MKPAILLAFFAALALSACNTVGGLGEDMSAAGSAVTSESEEVQSEM